MAVTKAQAAVTASGAVTTLALTLGSAPTAGNLLVALINNSASAPTVTPPAGWTTILNTANGTSAKVSAFYRVVQAGDAASYTFSFSASTPCQGYLVELAGQNATTPIDGSNSATGTSTAPSTGAVTPSAAGDLAIGGLVFFGPTTTTYGGAPSGGYSVDAGGVVGIHSEYVINSALTNGTATSSGDSLSASRAWAGQLVVVKAAAGGSAVQGQASLTGAATLTDAANVAHIGQASESAILAMTDKANVAHTGQSSESATLTLTDRANVAHTGRASEAATLTMSDRANVAHTGRLSVTAILTFGASALVGSGATADLVGSVSLASSGNVAHTGRATPTGVLDLLAAARAAYVASATETGDFTLIASGKVITALLPGVGMKVVLAASVGAKVVLAASATNDVVLAPPAPRKVALATN